MNSVIRVVTEKTKDVENVKSIIGEFSAEDFLVVLRGLRWLVDNDTNEECVRIALDLMDAVSQAKDNRWII